MTILNNIGRTRLIPLQHMVPETSARILVKLEYENPTGSMKDRMALAMVEAAEADGRLRPLSRALAPPGHYAGSLHACVSITQPCRSSP
jgi:cysteine synthase